MRADCLPNLRIDVIRQRVLGDRASLRHVEARIAGAPRAHEVDSGSLRRYADPGVARSHEVLVRLEPVGFYIVSVRHVEPFDQDGAVEQVRRYGPTHDDPSLVEMIAVDDRPSGIDAVG